MSRDTFVERCEQSTRQSIHESYKSIDMLHWELDFLNDLLAQYKNRKGGYKFTCGERYEEMQEIRERIAEIYKDINWYKECINAERDELQLIKKLCNKNNYNNYYEYESDYDSTYDREEIVEYKYYPGRDVFEKSTDKPRENQSNEDSVGGDWSSNDF